MLLEAVLVLALARPDNVVPRLNDYQFAQVQRVDVSDGPLKVSVENNAPAPEAAGWSLRVALDNTGGAATKVALEFRGNTQGVHSVTRSVELRAGERRVVVLPAPADLNSGLLTARGPTTKGAGAGVYFQKAYGGKAVVLSLGQPDAYERFVGKAPDYSGDPTVQVMSIAVNEVPTELGALSGYDAIVVPAPGTFDELDEGPRRAVEAYLLSGGALVMAGPVRVSQALPLLTDTKTGVHRYGFGTVWVQQGEQRWDVAREQLGVNPRAPAPEYERRWGGGTTRFEVLLPQATAPLGRFLIIIGLFTLAIGPGSILVARRRGPAMLLVTIPSTAFVTCALIIGYSLISDGFTVHASTYGLTLLDSKRHRAVTLGVNAYYANLAPSKATYTGSTALVAPWESNREYFTADMHWSDGLTVGADFIPSRLYREWGLLTVEPTRARVVVKRQGDAVIVQNALGFAVDVLNVNFEGKQYIARALRDGGEQTLVQGESTVAVPHPDRFSAAAVARINETLRPSEFTAKLTGTPGFVPTGGLNPLLYDAEHWVRGEVEQ